MKKSVYLCHKLANENTHKDPVVEKILKNIQFVVDLARIDLVEDGHDDKGRKDNGVVHRGVFADGLIASAGDIEDLLARKHKQ